MKANDTETDVQNASATELKENDLENVSGGFLGITIIDRCKNRFDPDICLVAIGGRCPRLVTESQCTIEGDGNTMHESVITCNKGCFHRVKFSYYGHRYCN